MDAETQQVEELKAEVQRLKVFENEVNTRCWDEMVLHNKLYQATQEIDRLKSENEILLKSVTKLSGK